MSEKKINWFKRHKILTILLAIVIIGLIAGAAGGGSSDTTKPAVTSTPSPNTEVSSTKSKIAINDFYSKVENGMSKEQVTQLAEREPKNCTELQDQYIGTTENCSYGGFGDKGVVSVTFTNGQVSMKTKTDF